MDRVLCGMRWSRCLVYLDDVISFGVSVSDALIRLEEVLCRLSDFGLQLKAKKRTFMQTEVAFLGHIVGRDPGNLERYWRFVPGICLARLKRCVSLWVLLDTVVDSSRTLLVCWSPWWP